MDVDKAFADAGLERNGAWLDYREGSRVLVARLGNPDFQRLYERLMRPHRAAEKSGRLGIQVQTDILCRCLADSILLGWEGFTKAGKELKYTPEAAYDLLHANLDFRNEIAELASAEDNFHARTLEEQSKN